MVCKNHDDDDDDDDQDETTGMQSNYVMTSVTLTTSDRQPLITARLPAYTNNTITTIIIIMMTQCNYHATDTHAPAVIAPPWQTWLKLLSCHSVGQRPSTISTSSALTHLHHHHNPQLPDDHTAQLAHLNLRNLSSNTHNKPMKTAHSCSEQVNHSLSLRKKIYTCILIYFIFGWNVQRNIKLI